MRKVPAQARSRATVEAIVEAATQVLGRRGWARFTTNEVADVAGASIGSLYQYFPNKLTLIEAIRRRHFQSVISVLQKACAEPIESSADSLVRGMLQLHRATPSLHKALLEEAPRSRVAAAEFDKEYHECYTLFVAKHLAGCRAASTRVIAGVLAAAIEGAVHHAAICGLSSSSQFTREISNMVRSYLGD